MPLSKYLSDTASLLHDSGFRFTSQQQLAIWVNEARRQCAQRSGCIRRLISGQSAFGASSQPGYAVPGGLQPGALPGAFPAGTAQNAAVNSLQTIPGQERYPYQGFFNPYAQQQHAGIKGIIDVIELSVNWGGAVRPTLAWLPWDELQAYARAYATLLESYPYYYSVLDDGENGEIWMFPAPSTTGDIEADAFCVPTDLYTDADYDAIPAGYQNSIKYGAAALAYLSSQRYAQSQFMSDLFNERIGVAGVARDRGKTANYYWSAY